MPVYEYSCPFHGVWEKLTRSIPDPLPRALPCPLTCERVEGQEHVCEADSMLVPSLGCYGDAQAKTMLRLSREQRRYHGTAPEREAQERKARATRRRTPITKAELQDRSERERYKK
jgi:hypothetical protein